jgi:hypothetical protein
VETAPEVREEHLGMDSAAGSKLTRDIQRIWEADSQLLDADCLEETLMCTYVGRVRTGHIVAEIHRVLKPGGSQSSKCRDWIRC